MNTRRSFFKKSVGIAGTLSLAPFAGEAMTENISDALLSLNKLNPFDAKTDEELWERMAQAYTVSPSILNLNNISVAVKAIVLEGTC